MSNLSAADLASIETVVGAYLAGCEPLLNVFREGRNAYVDFAAKANGVPYSKIAEGLKSKDPAIKAWAKLLRQLAKPGVLGAIYRLSGGGWGFSKKGYKDHDLDCNAEEVGKKYCRCKMVYDRIKTGLWGYSEAMGIEMSQEKAHEIVRMFREAYREIPEMWYAMENAVADVLHPDAVKVTRQLGPNGCVKFDKLTIKPTDGSDKWFILRMQLPAGSYLHYYNARIEETRMPWKDGEGRDVYRPALVYDGVDQDTKQWGYVTSHGGKLFENAVQGTARDVLAEKLLIMEQEGIHVIGHVHDEAIAETEGGDFSFNHRNIVEIMSRPISWAPGLPLGADGFDDLFYHK